MHAVGVEDSGTGWRLGHLPALDGLRGVAILLVLACHGLVPWFLWAGGAVGVAVFFTLSGFLITSLLLQDQEQVGRIRFARFYARRTRRLLPALLALVAVILLLGASGALIDGAVQWPTVVGSVFYSANWVMAIHGPYPHDVLGHTWSLSIEEQFYVVWPIVFAMLARRSLRLVMWVGGLVCAAALVERMLLWDPALGDNARIYFGTDTRTDGLMFGCLLAVAMKSVRVERARPLVVLWGFAGIALATAFRGPGVIVLAPTVVSLATCAVIFGGAQDGGFRGLEWQPLRWVGQRSYGIYLWHAPVGAVAGRVVGHAWWVYAPTLLSGALLVAAASWRFIESPWLRRSGDAGDSAQELEGGDRLGAGAAVAGVHTDISRGERRLGDHRLASAPLDTVG